MERFYNSTIPIKYNKILILYYTKKNNIVYVLIETKFLYRETVKVRVLSIS